MDKKKYMICPVHSTVHMEKADEGVILQGDKFLCKTNMFYCLKCDRYYFNTKYLAQDKVMKFKGKSAVNVTVKEATRKNGSMIVADGYVDKRAMVLKPSEIVMYQKDTTPVYCPNDNTDLIFKQNLNIVCLDGVVSVAGYYCDTCKKAYISKRMLENIMSVHSDEFVVAFNTIKENMQNDRVNNDKTIKEENIDKENSEFNPTDGFIEDISLVERKYRLVDVLPCDEDNKPLESDNIDEERSSSDVLDSKGSTKKHKKRKEISDEIVPFNTFDELESSYDNTYPFSLLHYAFIFRRYDKVVEIFKDLDSKEIEKALHIRGPKGYEWITPLVCARWNLNYLCAYDERTNGKIMEKIIPYIDEVNDISLACEYDNILNDRCVNDSIFDLFFKNSQPLLDVSFRHNYELPALQIDKNFASIVINEKGADRKIAAYYAIKHEIEKAIASGTKAKVLIICPYHKLEEWQSDIRHHLGRFAHIVKKEDMGEMYSGELKKVYFKNSEHNIFIVGQLQTNNKNEKGSELKGSLEYFSKSSQWDIAVIDDVHRAFNNYKMIRAKRAMIISSNPIVLEKNDEIRNLNDYKKLLSDITGKNFDNKKIMPAKNGMPTIKDIYVNWFKEDLGQVCMDKNVRFVICARHRKRQRFFSKIEHLSDRKTALMYDQDDEFLFNCARNVYGIENVPVIEENLKLNELVRVLSDDSKSCIIFCEHAEVANNIFSTLKKRFKDCIVACKKGRIEEVYGMENVYEGQLLPELLSKNSGDDRVILVTTEKFAAKELDLSIFEEIIHYELPYTSMELDSRFGQIKKDISLWDNRVVDEIFMVNECNEGQNDVEINRMLYYCMTKIDVACKYMPLRNTVFYSPKFIKTIKEKIIMSLNCFLNNDILSFENEQKVTAMKDELSNMQNELKQEDCFKYVAIDNLPFDRICKKVLEEERKDNISEEFYVKISDYMKYWEKTYKNRNEYHRAYKQFLKTEDKILKWLGIIGVYSSVDDSIFACNNALTYEEKEKVNDSLYENILDNYTSEKYEGISIVHGRIDYILDMIKKVDFYNLDVTNYLVEGVFYYKDNSIIRTNVNNIRFR